MSSEHFHRPSGAKDVAKYTSVKLRVTNIKFSHDTSSSSKDAINIRRSCAKGIDVSNGERIDSGDIVTNEPFCYTTNRAVTVKARFEASGFITSAVIRAICAGPFCGESTRIDYLNRAIDRSTQEEELLSFYTSLRMPNFLFKNDKGDYSEKASFPIH